jgi:hypothetical protein
LCAGVIQSGKSFILTWFGLQQTFSALPRIQSLLTLLYGPCNYHMRYIKHITFGFLTCTTFGYAQVPNQKYFHEIPPGTTAKIFSRDKVSTKNEFESGAVFSNDRSQFCHYLLFLYFLNTCRIQPLRLSHLHSDNYIFVGEICIVT